MKTEKTYPDSFVGSGMCVKERNIQTTARLF